MFWRRTRSQRDFHDEIKAHLELEREDLIDEGVEPSEAPYIARRAFGSVASIQERYYEASGMLWDQLKQDVVYGFRALFRSPGYAVAAISTLGLGIGATVASFAAVQGVLLRPLPYSHPERIVVLETFYKNTGLTGQTVSAPDFHDWRRQNRVLEVLAYHNGGETATIANGVSSFARAQRVTPQFFSVFGASPAAGRLWSEEEDGTPVAVISRRWALQQFGDVQRAIAKSITVSGRSFEVLGVASDGFSYPGETDIWTPARLSEENPRRDSHNYLAVGRLKAGVTVDAARREMRDIGDRLGQQYSENRFKTVALRSLHDKVTSSAERTLWIALGAVFAVLLIACTNVANLQLARTASRTREMAVRAALGANGWRILRQALTEGALLSALGTALGLGLAWLFVQSLITIAPTDVPRLGEVRIDARVLMFAAALATLCSVVFGLAPAKTSAAPDLTSELKLGGRTVLQGSRSRTRSMLVVAEVALSVILLAGGGLLLRSFLSLTEVDLGFGTDRVLVTRMAISAPNEGAARRATELQRDLLERIRALPGVRRAAGVRTMPFAGGRATGTYSIEGGPVHRPGEGPGAQLQIVTPDYFATMGMQILEGRDFTPSDRLGQPQVALINHALAREAFGFGDPLGRRISAGMTLESSKGMEIVGVVSDARQTAPGDPSQAEIFMPHLQHPGPSTSLNVLVQTHAEPIAMASEIRVITQAMDPQIPVRFSTVDEIVFDSLAYPRFRAILIGLFSLLAMGLAVIGIYSVISYLVSQRAGEIGLRLALGADRGEVFRSVIAGSLRLVICGLILGLVGTLIASEVLESVLFEVSPRDPITIGSVLLLITLSALAGSSIPALRAARLDPLIALRQP
jgi:predicted permease